ncbi:hypothetical protein [Mameliella sp.]|uniref:hypothetical protein n=1 Tax=Mameliella sp. TaxID=1924940 RepID=UPI003B500AAE
MAAVLAELDSYGLTLTEEMVEGLYDLARSLELMAEGLLPPQFHLSSLDPGGTLVSPLKLHFARTVIADFLAG